MDSSLHELWHSASASPFQPAIGKGNQFLVGFTLLLIGLSVTGAYAFNRSLVNLPVYGVPAGLAIACVFNSSTTRPFNPVLTIRQLRNGLHVLRGRSLRLEEEEKSIRYPQKYLWWTEEDVPVYHR
ncbi:hypothetical protein F4808DRAFT_462826 [Astrocystis sublimbata]|nr:hypothetical protein F4808DRAFT_462826 [Astrocystis sublimbata]